MTRTTVTTVVTELKKDIEYIKKDLTLNRDEHKDILVALQNLDKKFAGKWIEKIAISTAATMIAILIGIMVYGVQ
ncbi:hypothetical protein DRN98_03970 [Methanosarcinales archaeon]|nr:MAG: hypothetical protein DRN98_03970 [Methanosarcinales archaeon]